MKRAQKGAQKKKARVLVELVTSKIRRPSHTSTFPDDAPFKRIEEPDDVFLIQPYETGESYGPFSGEALLNAFLSWDLRAWGSFLMLGDFNGQPTLTRREFTNWRELIECALATPGRQWRAAMEAAGWEPSYIEKLHQRLPATADFDGPVGTLRLAPETVLDAIIATVQLAKIMEGDFRRCANPKCRKPPFPIGSHDRQWCSKKCGHTTNTRKRRKVEKETAATAKASVVGDTLEEVREVTRTEA